MGDDMYSHQPTTSSSNSFSCLNCLSAACARRTGSSSTLIDYLTTSEQTLVTLTVSNSGASAQVTANMFASHENNNQVISSSEYRMFHFLLKRNGSSIAGLTNCRVGHQNVPSFTLPALDTPGAGSVTYTLTVQNSGGNTSKTKILYPSISYVELKK